MCDWPVIKSRDHTILNCRGTNALKRHIDYKYDIQIDSDCIYHINFTNANYKIKYVYLYTIMISHQAQEGKWGKMHEKAIINLFESTLSTTF